MEILGILWSNSRMSRKDVWFTLWKRDLLFITIFRLLIEDNHVFANYTDFIALWVLIILYLTKYRCTNFNWLYSLNPESNRSLTLAAMSSKLGVLSDSSILLWRSKSSVWLKKKKNGKYCQLIIAKTTENLNESAIFIANLVHVVPLHVNTMVSLVHELSISMDPPPQALTSEVPLQK